MQGCAAADSGKAVRKKDPAAWVSKSPGIRGRLFSEDMFSEEQAGWLRAFISKREVLGETI